MNEVICYWRRWSRCFPLDIDDLDGSGRAVKSARVFFLDALQTDLALGKFADDDLDEGFDAELILGA